MRQLSGTLLFAISVIVTTSGAIGCVRSACAADHDSEQQYDVVVYGATSGGVTAAIQSARMGKSVVLVGQNASVA
jgi:ribulose 1,5-bisphosphate synthetase/thiazole synthase